MNKQFSYIKTVFITFIALGIAGCGGADISRSNVTPKALPKSNSSLSGGGPVHKLRIDRSINQIRNNPLTKDFPVTVSYPYVITGNLSQAELEHWKSRVQRTQAAVKKMYFKQNPSEVVQIWLFKDESSFLHYNKALWDASPGTSFGYYLPQQKRMMMNIASGGGTLTHELVHPYIEANFPQSPLWFNEGLASLYEQSYYKGGKVYGAPNWRLKGLQMVIRADSMPSLMTMMKTNRTQFLGGNREVYYAQARYLLLYLQSRGLLESYYRQFTKDVASDPTGIATLLGLTKFQSMEQLEKNWIRYIGKLRF
jgi:hypothetical protein